MQSENASCQGASWPFILSIQAHDGLGGRASNWPREASEPAKGGHARKLAVAQRAGTDVVFKAEATLAVAVIHWHFR